MPLSLKMYSNGQRIYCSQDSTLPKPRRGSEIFVGKIPRNMFESDLIPIFETIGSIYKFRLMLDFSGSHRGFAFVTYTNPSLANMAIDMLHDYEVLPNQRIGVYKSIDNCRLFVGRIDPFKTKGEVMEKLREYVNSIVDVIMYKGHIRGHVNRGYVFVEFEDHKAAAIARKLLCSGVALWDHVIVADWADPIPEVPDEIMKKVTKLYIHNLNVTWSKEFLLDQLSSVIDPKDITKVHKVKAYAFVHFNKRQNAELAMRELKDKNRIKYLGENVQVSWGRPSRFSKMNRLKTPTSNFCISVPPRMRSMVRLSKINVMKDRYRSSSMAGSLSSFGNTRSSDSFSPDRVNGPFGGLDHVNIQGKCCSACNNQ